MVSPSGFFLSPTVINPYPVDLRLFLEHSSFTVDQHQQAASRGPRDLGTAMIHNKSVARFIRKTIHLFHNRSLKICSRRCSAVPEKKITRCRPSGDEMSCDTSFSQLGSHPTKNSAIRNKQRTIKDLPHNTLNGM